MGFVFGTLTQVLTFAFVEVYERVLWAVIESPFKVARSAVTEGSKQVFSPVVG